MRGLTLSAKEQNRLQVLNGVKSGQWRMSEAAHGTFQDRLVSELRLDGATTLSETNYVLADFLPRFNQRFGVAAAQPDAVYRPLDPGLDLAGVLCSDIVDDKLSQTKGESIPPQIAPSCRRLHAPRCGSETCKVYPGRHSH